MTSRLQTIVALGVIPVPPIVDDTWEINVGAVVLAADARKFATHVCRQDPARR